MITIATSILPLLLGIGLLLIGIGLQGSLLGLRANLEGFPVPVTGMVMSGYFLGFIIGTFLCPRLIRRVGHIRAFAAFAAVTAAAAVAHGLLVEPWLWGGLRIVTGTAMVGLYMVIESWLNLIAPNATRGRYFAVYTTTTLFAMALGQYLLLADDIGNYRLFSITAILVALAVVPIALTRINQPPMVATPSLGLRQLYHGSPLGVIGALITGLNNGAFWGLGALFAERIGLNAGGIALLMSLTIIGGALLQWPIGHFSDRHDRRSVLLVVSLVGAILAITTYLILDTPAPWMLLLAISYGGFAFALYGLSIAHANDQLAPEDLLEGARNLLLIYGIGAMVGPTIASLVMARLGAGSLLLFLAANLIALALFAAYRMRMREALPTEEQMEFVAVVRTSSAALEMDPRLEVEGELPQTADSRAG